MTTLAPRYSPPPTRPPPTRPPPTDSLPFACGPSIPQAAVEETPEHELRLEDDRLVLQVRVPRVYVVDDLDVQIGDRTVGLRAEGLYTLTLELPQPIRSEAARCKFDKKKRVLTVTMPV